MLYSIMHAVIMNIEFNDDGMKIPDNLSIGYIEGEGIGPEITSAMIKVINSSIELAYSGDKFIEWMKILVGKDAYEKYNKYMPDESIEEIKKYVITMKSTLNLLPDKDDINTLLRRKLGLYTNIRIVKYLPGINVNIESFNKINITIIRDSVNGSYSFYHSLENTKDLIKYISENYDININEDSSIAMITQSKFRTKKIIKKIIDFYRINKNRKITVVYSDLNPEFLDWCREELKKSHDVPYEYLKFNDFIKKLINNPEDFDLVFLDNIINRTVINYIINIVNVEYGCSIGDQCAFFEAVQSSSPDEEGYDIADPLSFILSGSLMLRYIGWNEASKIIDNAIKQTFIDNKIPKDYVGNGKTVPVKCSQFADEIIKRMKKE